MSQGSASGTMTTGCFSLCACCSSSIEIGVAGIVRCEIVCVCVCLRVLTRVCINVCMHIYVLHVQVLGQIYRFGRRDGQGFGCRGRISQDFLEEQN